MQPTLLNLVESATLKPEEATIMGMKGHPQSGGGGCCGGCGGGSGGGGGWKKSKIKMALMAVLLLVGVMGLMVVQKVRDRRMFNLVIKDKDRQILSLHLLLQKERQYVKEYKKKNQDLNAKLYSLRTQKTELDSKIMEMRSTIGSMRDEQRALELTIDEKQNEMKQKESKINDLKTTLHSSPPNIWSVSSDDPSNREQNLTGKVTTAINPNVRVQSPSLDAKSKLKNSTTMDVKETRGNYEENGGGLSVKGRRSFIGEGNKGTWKKSEGERKDEDEVDVSMESGNGSEADQDYKEEMED